MRPHEIHVLCDTLCALFRGVVESLCLSPETPLPLYSETALELCLGGCAEDVFVVVVL